MTLITRIQTYFPPQPHFTYEIKRKVHGSSWLFKQQCIILTKYLFTYLLDNSPLTIILHVHYLSRLATVFHNYNENWFGRCRKILCFICSTKRFSDFIKWKWMIFFKIIFVNFPVSKHTILNQQIVFILNPIKKIRKYWSIKLIEIKFSNMHTTYMKALDQGKLFWLKLWTNYNMAMGCIRKKT